MNRRCLWIVVAALCLLLAVPRAAGAQQPGKVYRVGLVFFSSDPTSPVVRVFRYALGHLGYVEGQNLVLERRYLEGRIERAPEVVAELVALRVDVIMTANPLAARGAKEATKSIPIVMVTVVRPLNWAL